MVDGLALCSCACVTCLWFTLLALCFPRFFKKLQEPDSDDDCCPVCPNKTWTDVKTECERNTRVRRSNRMTDKCKSSVNDNSDEKNKDRTRIHSPPIRYREPPKCRVKIIRKSRTRPQCRRNESSGPGEDDRGLFLPQECETARKIDDDNFTENSAAQTELFYPQRRDTEEQKRLQRVRVKDESDDFEGEESNRNGEIDEKIYSDGNISDDSAAGVRRKIETEVRRVSYIKKPKIRS